MVGSKKILYEKVLNDVRPTDIRPVRPIDGKIQRMLEGDFSEQKAHDSCACDSAANSVPSPDDDEEKCITCCDAPRTVAFVPCSHKVLCRACTVEYRKSKAKLPYFATLENLSPKFYAEHCEKMTCPTCREKALFIMELKY